MFVSYAQNYEDVYLDRMFGRLSAGSWIDVGAWLPDIDSVTKSLSERGWSGVNVEPNPAALAALLAQRPRDVNLGVALGAESGETVLHVVDRTGLSSTDAELATSGATHVGAALTSVPVQVRTLDDVWDEHIGADTVQFLKIDVEGAEAEVLAGLDLARHRPQVLIVEAVEPNGTARTDAAWATLITAHRYDAALFDGLNVWFVAAESAALAEHLRLPINHSDNVIRARDVSGSDAVRIEELEQQLLAAQRVTAETAAERDRLRARLDEVLGSRTWRLNRQLHTFMGRNR